MEEKDVIENSGVSKSKLESYEARNLIHVAINGNNEKEYNQEDLRLISIIKQLEGYELSLDEIEMIFYNQRTLQDSLSFKSDKVQKKVRQQKDNIERLSKNINRRIALITINDITSDQSHEIYVNFKNDQVIIHDNYDLKHRDIIELSYRDIQKVKLSMCTRARSRSINNLNFVFVGVSSNNTMSSYSGYGLASDYHIDFDIYTKDSIFKYESMSIKDISKVMLLIKENNVVLEDPMNIVDFFIDNTSEYALDTALKAFFNKNAKKYNLDRPRSVEISNQVKSVKKEMTDYATSKNQPDNNKLKYLFKNHKKGLLIGCLEIVFIASIFYFIITGM